MTESPTARIRADLNLLSETIKEAREYTDRSTEEQRQLDLMDELIVRIRDNMAFIQTAVSVVQHQVQRL